MTAKIIVAGPSKWDIMISIFEGTKVRFTADDGSVVRSRIQAIFDNMGWYLGDKPILKSQAYLFAGEFEEDEKSIKFFAYYSPSERSGFISTNVLDDGSFFDAGRDGYTELHEVWVKHILGSTTT